MPLVRIDHPSGKPAAYRDALSEGVYEGMRSTFAVPEDDRFPILSEHSNTEIVYPDRYLGIS
jgi:4-oxalocrotonate tautomerase